MTYVWRPRYHTAIGPTLGQPQPLCWAHVGKHGWHNVGLSVGPMVYQRHLTAPVIHRWATVAPTSINRRWATIGTTLGQRQVSVGLTASLHWAHVGSSVGKTVAPVVGPTLGYLLGQRKLAAPVGHHWPNGRPKSINCRWATIGTMLGQQQVSIGPTEGHRSAHVGPTLDCPMPVGHRWPNGGPMSVDLMWPFPSHSLT